MTCQPPDALVAARHLSIHRHSRTILDDVQLYVRPGEIVTVIGPNGAGKSTLIRALLGLTRADGGEVWRKAGLRIGYSPQRLALDPVLPLTAERFLTLAGPTPRSRLLERLGEVGAAELGPRQMTSLSGGELQRVLLARALLRDPHLLVLDEPLAGVDIAGQAELYALIASIRDRSGAGILLVSHDLHVVMARTDRVVCIDRHVCCSGHPVEVARDPAFLRLFGPRLGHAVALYSHDMAHHAHDHAHRDPG